MKSLIAGVKDGRSCILSEIQIEDRDVNREGPSSRTDVYSVKETPPPARPPTKAAFHDTGLEPGHLDLCVLQMPAGVEHPMHYTDTLNFHTIVAGSVDIVLDDGPHRLEVGDSLVMPGIDHGWKAGPSGCTQTIMNLGSARP